MTVRIVDRRQDSKNKSSINRGRFIQRFGSDPQGGGRRHCQAGHRDLDNGEKIGIPAGYFRTEFRHGRGGRRDMVHPGNDRINTGDEVERPWGRRARKGKASDQGEGWTISSLP